MKYLIKIYIETDENIEQIANYAFQNITDEYDYEEAEVTTEEIVTRLKDEKRGTYPDKSDIAN